MNKLKAIIMMSIISFLFGCSKKDVNTLSPTIDLKLFTVGNTVLNQPISASDIFYDHFRTKEVLNLPQDGIEIGVNKNLLDYAFVTIETFKGRFMIDGVELKLSQKNTPDSIVKIFGDPFWIDQSDGEIIQFYEYKNGLIELQFEYSDSTHLSHITLMVNGVLSTEEQRKNYGVNKPWPPKG